MQDAHDFCIGPFISPLLLSQWGKREGGVLFQRRMKEIKSMRFLYKPLKLAAPCWSARG